MLTPIADGVRVHQSELLQNNTVVVQGPTGVLLIDPGIRRVEMVALAHELRGLGQAVVAGFSTHPHWDHALWHADFGDVPRYGTERGAVELRDLLSQADWQAQVAEGLPPEIADEVPMELFGQVTGLPAGAARIPWDGPGVRILEHRGHSVGHAALFIEERGVLVAGDMLSDILIPFLDLAASDPAGDYLEGLRVLASVAADAEAVVPGHGSVGGRGAARDRIALDRAYVEALREGRDPGDPRVGPAATYGRDWLPDIHRWQAGQLAGQTTGERS